MEENKQARPTTFTNRIKKEFSMVGSVNEE